MLETARELGAEEFVRYVRQNGLHDLLTGGGPYTLFVPTDEAFAVNFIDFDTSPARYIYNRLFVDLLFSRKWTALPD